MTVGFLFSFIQAEHPTGDDVDSGLYQAMRKELRHAVEEIKMELEQVCFFSPCFSLSFPSFKLVILGIAPAL